MPEFVGLKLSQDATVCGRFRDVHKVEVERDRHAILMDQPGHVGSGQNSGFQLLNVCIQFGARRFILVGYDMRTGDDGKVHWHGTHGGELSNPSPRTLDRWRGIFDGLGKRLSELGVEVINASPTSAITLFPKMPFEQAMDLLTVNQKG